jgi:metallo-beta-lactamase class B
MKPKSAILVAGALALLALVSLAACSASVREGVWATLRNDNGPRAPFEIAPGLYYVGASDVAVYALQTTDGLILIDGGYPSTAPRVLENLRTLHLDPADVRVLLNTHAHFDHAGGLAQLKRETGAEFYASADDRVLLEAGGRGDFFLRDWMTYPPVSVDRVLEDGDEVRLGETVLTAHLTPGHTKGCTTWSFDVEIAGQVRPVLLLCGLAVLRYNLIDDPDYPNIAEDFSATYDRLRALPCELFLSQHASHFGIDAKRAEQLAGADENPFLDADGCRAHIAGAERAFRETLARQSRRHQPSIVR